MMKPYLLMLGVLWFLVGCRVGASTAEETRFVQEAVIRYQLQDIGVVLGGEVKIFCVRLVVGADRLDPPIEFIKRLNDGPRKVLPGSSCDDATGSGVVEKASGKPAAILEVGNVVWQSSTTATVEGCYYQGPRLASGNIYHLKKVNGRWSVITDETKWVS